MSCLGKRRHFPRLYPRIREELKHYDISWDIVAEELGISRRSLEMKMSNIEGSGFRIGEMYRLLHLIGKSDDQLAVYFPNYPTRRRIG